MLSKNCSNIKNKIHWLVGWLVCWPINFFFFGHLSVGWLAGWLFWWLVECYAVLNNYNYKLMNNIFKTTCSGALGHSIYSGP